MAVLRLNVEKSLGIFRPDTDPADGGQQIFLFLIRQAAVYRDAHVFDSVVLLVAQPVFGPDPEHVPLAGIEIVHHAAMLGPDTVIQIRRRH